MSDIVYELIRSKRKSISVEISREARVVVRAPLKMKAEDIGAFVDAKRDWIIKHRTKMEQTLEDLPKKLDENELKVLKKSARALILPRLEHYAALMGVKYNRVSFRRQKTRFGSCSTSKSLSFNIAVALMPEEIVDYVIVHELAHLKEMNHSARFWREVECIIPDYSDRRKWLHENGIKYVSQI